MNTLSIFIAPNISKFSSFSELENSEKSLKYFVTEDEAKITIFDIMKLKKTIILAEPGLGKTMLLQEIVLQAGEAGYKAIYINLKKIESNFSDYMKTNVAKPKNVGNTGQDVITNAVFKLTNSDAIIVCLDALDEVQASNVSNIVDGIKNFQTNYPDIAIHITCRRNYYQQYASVLTDDSFSFLTLNIFSQEQVEKYLVEAGIDQSTIEKLTRKLQFKNRNLILQVPRYLCMLPEILSKKEKDFEKISKSDLFRKFAFNKLDVEKKKGTKDLSQKVDLITRVLGKVALIMEIQQSNLLKKLDLITLFDDIKSNLCVSFFTQVDITVLYERSLLRDNFDGTVQFESTEIQEYLAAVEISRLGHVQQVVFDLAIEPELLEIYPSWYNTLCFLVELDPEIVFQIAQLTRSKKHKLQREDFHKLITSVPELISLDHANDIFHQVFEYYQVNKIYLGMNICENLARFPIMLPKLYANLRDLEEVQKENIARFAGYRGRYYPSEIDQWKTILLVLAKENNPELLEEIVFAFGQIKDMDSLAVVADPLLAKKSKGTIAIIISSCIAANPNHPFSIRAFIEGTKEDEIMARYGFYALTEGIAVKAVINSLITDAVFRSKFIEDETIFKDSDKKIIDMVERYWDSEFTQKISSLITEILKDREAWDAGKSALIEKLVVLACKHETRFIFIVIDAIISPTVVDLTLENWYYWPRLLGLMLKQGQIKDVISKLSGCPKGMDIIFQTLQYIGSQGTDDAKKVFEEGRCYFRKDFKALSHKPKMPKRKQKSSSEIYSKFKFKLEPEPGKYSPDVFAYFWANRKILDPIMEQEDFDRLKRLITDSVLNVFDIERTTLQIIKKDGVETRYTTSNLVFLFKDCLMIISEYNHILKIDLNDYKEKLINYIPFAYPEELEIIFNFLPNLSVEDLNGLIQIYIGGRKDDLCNFAPRNFLTVCKHYSIQAIDAFKTIIENEEIDIFVREEALNTLINLSSDKQTLQIFFNLYSGDDQAPSYRLALKANEGLIDFFKENSAILWRITELAKRKFSFIRPEGGHIVSHQERELNDKSFARPIMNLRDPVYEDMIIDLADKAFEIYGEDLNYRAYGTYLWKIAVDYYNNLREMRTYRYLLSLIKHIEAKYSNHPAYVYFSYDLHDLNFNYLQYLGHPNDFATCIKKYNEVKEKQYLDISCPRELFELIHTILDEDILNWIEAEGAYRYIQEHQVNEDLIQKTLKTQIENGLLKRGVRRAEVRREEQLLDDKRPDMLINYGFIGPILIELKLSDNRELANATERDKYKTKLKQYIDATGAYFGLFLIFRVKQTSDLVKVYTEVTKTYSDCNQIYVKTFDCIKSLPIVKIKRTRKPKPKPVTEKH